MKKTFIFILIILMAAIFISGCSNDKYFSSKNDNIIPDSLYENFDGDLPDIFSYDDDGKICADYGFKKGIQSGTDVVLEGHGVAIWGVSTISQFELDTTKEITISRNEKVKSGEFKLLLCDKNGVIEYIDKNDSVTISLEAGIYKLKVIGKPAQLSKLCIQLAGLQ